MTEKPRGEVFIQEKLAAETDPKAALEQLVMKLDFDDRAGGIALAGFKENLRTIAKRVEDLERAGYKIRIDYKEDTSGFVYGAIEVFLERGGQSEVILDDLYDSYSDAYRTEGPDRLKRSFELERLRVEENIDRALKFSKMFKKDEKE